jgi:hypothetical protein
MAQALAPLVQHLTGLIYLAEMAWQGSPENHMRMARTFRDIGQAYEIAALAQQDNLSARVQISEDDILL